MDGFKMVVDGFVFTDEKTAQKACQEEDSIRYVKDRLDMGNPRMVLEMYHKLLSEQVFETPIGLLYLKNLQNYLLAAPELEKEGVEAIPVYEGQISQAFNQDEMIHTEAAQKNPMPAVAPQGSAQADTKPMTPQAAATHASPPRAAFFLMLGDAGDAGTTPCSMILFGTISMISPM